MSKAPVRHQPGSVEQVRARSLDSRILGGLLVTFGAGWIGVSAGLPGLKWEVVLSAVLLVLGMGMIFTAKAASTSIRLIAVGVLVTLALATTSKANIGEWRGGLGRRDLTPATLTQRTSFDHMAGDFTVDLGDARLPSGNEDVDVDVNMGWGQVRVVVPDDVDVEVTYKLAWGGEAWVLGNRYEGGKITHRVTEAAPSGNRRTLRLNIKVVGGEIRVHREGKA